jgi:kynurenine 3-monooxygenase
VNDSYVIAGAGLAGGLMATLLAQAGHSVIALERRSDPRSAGAQGGRSINLALSARGLHALDQVGLQETILALSVPLYGRMIHSSGGKLAFQPYGTRGRSIHSLSRSGLNAALLDAAERAGAKLRFHTRCIGLDLERCEALVQSADREERVAGIVVGADGAYSAVRGELQRNERQDYSQSYLTHGYRELYIPPAEAGGHRLDPNALHIWPRGGFMMMAMANVDGSFTVTLYLPFEGPESFASLGEPGAVPRFFQRQFPDALPLLPDLEAAWSEHPIGSLVTVRTRPWQVDGKVVLVGDACHAIVPFYGQGANAAFEDCVLLRDMLRRYPADRARAFGEYEASRRPNTEAIADLALANFFEMRDHVASAWFRIEKRGEVLLNRLFPRWYLPLYTMISFTRIPYAEARARAVKQQRVIRAIGIVLAILVMAILFGVISGNR